MNRILNFLPVICSMQRDKNLAACLLFLITGVFLSILYLHRPVHDYGTYYFGSRFALEGIPAGDIYEPYKFNLLIRQFPGMAHEPFFENYAVVPPFSIVVFTPFVLLPPFESKLLFNVLSVLLFSASLFRLLRHLHIRSWLVLLLPIILFIPFRNNILFGQCYLVLCVLLMEGFLAEAGNRKKLAAVFYGLAIALKIFPVILLCYLFIKKKRVLAGLTILFSGVFFLSALWVTGWPLMSKYLSHFLPRILANEINNPYAFNHQSIPVLLRNLFVPDQLLNPAPPFHSGTLFILLTGLFSGTVFFFLIKKLKQEENDFSQFAFTLLAGLTIAAYSSTYSLILLLPAGIGLPGPAMRKNIFLLVAIGAVCWIPAGSFQQFPLLLRFPRAYLILLLFFISSGITHLSARDLRLYAGCLFVFAATGFFASRTREGGSSYLLNREVSLLSYGFRFEKNAVIIKVLDENGLAEKKILLADTISTVTKLPLLDDVIQFQDERIGGLDQKLNPVLVNDHTIVYLSDQNRGIGFYALRKIELSAVKNY